MVGRTGTPRLGCLHMPGTCVAGCATSLTRRDAAPFLHMDVEVMKVPGVVREVTGSACGDPACLRATEEEEANSI